jgi:hypothetical protein
MEIIRDIRHWNLHCSRITDLEYHQLITELERQEKGDMTFTEFWEDDLDGTLGGQLTAFSLFCACDANASSRAPNPVN